MLDKTDLKLLSLLQHDCTLSLQALADAVNLTTTHLLEAPEKA
ncbi:DNA-binding Lrp family transcriptional regulator [Pantoea agglomerans]|nr:DNA-binding Lrp family transcriptional regulator [Pantoea agglomerans]